MKNVAIIISTSNKEKAVAAATLAGVSRKNKFFGDVKLIFFGPSERFIADNDETIMKLINDYNSAGDSKAIACKLVATNLNLLDRLDKVSLVKLDMVGPIIKDLAEKDYEFLTF
ncbi:hypothetical protein [Picrophilus oshimae]|uniref:DsrE/DsrF-like family protein n=1 Tax=Picrophilus torridus (strain ATCC 700027 / DSM 9790 / JCM 10055 / NBRC 100828 / KAW 2/3) TaxID=1122961 RepID=A0A8G2L8J0_PICTO|nr:hypothetical protein [Picrophilus oshimae]SMD31514.1 hypothetical protein SAMN02745355_1461 [Picrophilus oshimae DSM 9789]